METSIRKKEQQIVELRKFSSQLDADIAQGILRGAGIMCEVNDFLMDSIYPMESMRMNSIRLLVNEEDVELANKILEAEFVEEN